MESIVVRVIEELHSAIFDECRFNLDEEDVNKVFGNGYRYFCGHSVAMKKSEIGVAINKAIETAGVCVSDDYNLWMHIRSGSSTDDLANATRWLMKIYSADPLLSSIQDESIGEKVEIFIVLSKKD